MLRLLSASLVSATLAVAVTVTSIAPAQAQSRQQILRNISKHFSSVPTMTGRFVQFGPRGRQTQGKFWLKRPGKIRFDYSKPAALTVKANGRTVSVYNRKLKTRDYLPLSKTPLKLLLARKISPNNRAIKSVKSSKGIATVVLADRRMFGASRITLMFDAKTYDLRQWTIRDKQGRDTSVIISDVRKNVGIPNKLFRIQKRSQSQNVSGR